MVKIVLKDGWVYRGSIISETDSLIVLNDIKIGRIEISKDAIAILQRGDFNGNP